MSSSRICCGWTGQACCCLRPRSRWRCLRRWFHEDRARFDAFAERYRAELASPDWQEPLRKVVDLVERGDVVLLTAATDVRHSHAPVLAEVLQLA